MMLILAHRGNLEGPDHRRENTREAVAQALALGFGLETDIRRWPDGRLYISHDPKAPGKAEEAHSHVALWARYPQALVALNLKELGYEDAILELLQAQHRMARTFLFDMELIEPRPGETAVRLRELDSSILLASRASDRGESPERALGLPGPYLWLDEMDGTWAGPSEIRGFQAAGRKVIGVSRDLHGDGPESCFGRWEQFREWGLDGICTDWPLLLAERLGQRVERA